MYLIFKIKFTYEYFEMSNLNVRKRMVTKLISAYLPGFVSNVMFQIYCYAR